MVGKETPPIPLKENMKLVIVFSNHAQAMMIRFNQSKQDYENNLKTWEDNIHNPENASDKITKELFQELKRAQPVVYT